MCTYVIYTYIYGYYLCQLVFTFVVSILKVLTCLHPSYCHLCFPVFTRVVTTCIWFFSFGLFLAVIVCVHLILHVLPCIILVNLQLPVFIQVITTLCYPVFTWVVTYYVVDVYVFVYLLFSNHVCLYSPVLFCFYITQDSTGVPYPFHVYNYCRVILIGSCGPVNYCA